MSKSHSTALNWLFENFQLKNSNLARKLTPIIKLGGSILKFVNLTFLTLTGILMTLKCKIKVIHFYLRFLQNVGYILGQNG